MASDQEERPLPGLSKHDVAHWWLEKCRRALKEATDHSKRPQGGDPVDDNDDHT
jgi:hypothetical protein